MNIWIVTIGEPIINNRFNLRLHRSGLLAKYISENTNHKVTFVTSLFNHFTKEFEYKDEKTLRINENLKMILLKGKGYKKNVSFSRFYDHLIIQKKFRELLKSGRPDIIISSFPTIGLSFESVKFANKKSVISFVDIRDLWPEIFIDIIPSNFKFLGKIIFLPIFYITSIIFKKTTGILGVTDDYINVGLKRANRKKSTYDKSFPLGYNKLSINQKEKNLAIKFWESNGVMLDDGYINVCYFGTLGYQYDLTTVIKGFKKLKYNNIRLIICGSGDNEENLKKLALGDAKIIFPGYIDAIQIKVLMQYSDIGVYPPYKKENFIKNIPGKVVEYLSEGLVILNSLEDSLVGNLIRDQKFGSTYNSGDSDSFKNTLSKLINDIIAKKYNKQRMINFFEKNYDQIKVFKDFIHHVEKSVEKIRTNDI